MLATGALGRYDLPRECADTASFEVMERGDEPSRTRLNEIADWVDINFKADTRALIMIMQLYWEPALKFDSFGEPSADDN